VKTSPFSVWHGAWLLPLCLFVLFRACGNAQQPPPATPVPALLAADPKAPSPDAAATVVVFNEDDLESRSLAQFYAEKRNIPAAQVVGLKCSTAEEITRKEYDDTIAEPLRKIFTDNFWWKLRDPEDALGPVESNRIRYIALIRGIPLRIAPVASYEGDKPSTKSPDMAHNEAAVDSELALLGWRLKIISGAINNFYYRAFSPIREANRTEMMLVARLDGPTGAVVRRMIVDSLATEETGLRGMAYIDARGLPADDRYIDGDHWLQGAANLLQRQGMPVILDNGPGLFPEGYPMRQAALYFGWYSEEPAGPFVIPGVRFRPGAIACHIHSFSATTVRSAQSRWVGPLLHQGAAATLGNVYEPFLALTPNLDVFVERLRAGFTFAESAYMSQRVLSWMTTFVGDPLYRPFPTTPAVKNGPKENAEWDAYHDGAVKWFAKRQMGEAALQQSATKLKSGIIWEGLGLLQIRANDAKAGVVSFDKARTTYTNPDDILRATIHQVIQLKGLGRQDEAVSLAKQMSNIHRTSAAVTVLKMLVPAAFAQH